MSLALADIAVLQGVASPSLAEIIAVYWDGETNAPTYYAPADWNKFSNYRGLSADFPTIEARIVRPPLKDDSGVSPHAIPLFPDLNAGAIQITFADTDQTIKAKFTNENFFPPKFEIYHVWPALGLSDLKIFGHLKRPKDYGLAQQTVEGVIGLRSPEFLVPSEVHPRECRSRQYGKELATTDESAMCLCPYDRHLGGSVGLGGVSDSCPRRSKADCTARLGSDADIYWPGMDFEARGATVSSHFITSKGHPNDALMRYPVQIVWGAKIIMELPIFQFYTQQNAGNANRGTVHALAEVSIGPVLTIFNVLFNGSTSNVQSYQIRTGERGQSPTGWTFGVSNYSGVAHIYAVGNVSANPSSITNANGIKVGCYVHGYTKGRIYTDATTYTTEWNNNRVSALLEIYRNIRWGLGYDLGRIDLASWADVSTWSRENVRFTLTMDSDVKTWDLTHRTLFDATLPGQPYGDLVANLCRVGRFSIPYQKDGKYALTALRTWTGGELAAAEIFTDAIGGNIIRTANDSTLKLSQTDPKDLKNTVVCTFEDAENNDIKRPVTCKDPNAQALAGKILGSGGFFENKMSVEAIGVRRVEEALAYGYSVLWFGEFDKGGTLNNCSATFKTTYRQALVIQEKYQVIKIVSDQLTGINAPDGVQFEYFRVLDMMLNEDLSVTVYCQAYNKNAMDAFQVVLSGGEPPATESNTVDNFTPFEIVDEITPAVTYSAPYLEVTT